MEVRQLDDRKLSNLENRSPRLECKEEEFKYFSWDLGVLALSAVSENWGSGDSRVSSDKAKYRVMDSRQPLMHDAEGTKGCEKEREM